jgi:hypothetical protein
LPGIFPSCKQGCIFEALSAQIKNKYYIDPLAVFLYICLYIKLRVIPGAHYSISD